MDNLYHSQGKVHFLKLLSFKECPFPSDAGDMRRKQPIAPRAARKGPETQQQKKMRIQKRTLELIEIASRGETPREIFEKGDALAEVKRLRAWKYDDSGAKCFKDWVELKLPYEVAHANHYIFIASHLLRQRFLHTRLSFKALLVIARAPTDKREALIQAALSGKKAAELLRMAEGTEASGADSQKVRLDRVRRLQKKEATELVALREQAGQGEKLPADALLQICQEHARLGQLLAELAGTPGDPPGDPPVPPPADGAQKGAETDPRGSVSPYADYQPPALVLPDLNMAIPPEWPQDWFDTWVRTAPMPDDILLGAGGPSSQSGTLGLTLQGDFRLGLDLSGSFCAFFFGEGHLHAAGLITHMALDAVHHVNQLPRPLCAVHIICGAGGPDRQGPGEGPDPSSLWLRYPNRDPEQVRDLIEEMGATPAGLEDIVLLCKEDRVANMRRRHPHIRVFPLPQALAEPLRPLRRAGRLVVLDLRGLPRDQGLLLASQAMAVLTRPEEAQGQGFSMLLRVDRPEQGLGHAEFAATLTQLLQERQERRLGLLFSTEDPLRVPLRMLKEATLIGLGKAGSGDGMAWLSGAQRDFTRADAYRPAQLGPDQMMLWAQLAWAQGGEQARPGCIIEVQLRAATAQRGEIPPDHEETPPDHEETPPDDEETPPDHEETSPEEEETPPDDEE